jgi:hypothetical protein
MFAASALVTTPAASKQILRRLDLIERFPGKAPDLSKETGTQAMSARSNGLDPPMLARVGNILASPSDAAVPHFYWPVSPIAMPALSKKMWSSIRRGCMGQETPRQ